MIKKFNEFVVLEYKYEENVSITIETGDSNYLKNKSYDLEVNRKLMNILNKRFNLWNGEITDKVKIDSADISKISEFFKSIGLVKRISGDKLLFNGRITLKNIKKFAKDEMMMEFVNTPNLIDIKMQELKELVDSVAGDSLIYEWENKNDHEIFVNFSNDDISLRYEINIEDLNIVKVKNDVTEYEMEISSVDEAVDIIEKDIHSILGISERKS